MRIFILLIVSASFSACAIPQQGGMKGGLLGSMSRPVGMKRRQPQQPPPESQYVVNESVEVITEPPGARIFVNDASVGFAPVKTEVRRLWRGDPAYPMTLDTVKIEAMPVAAGQCVQSATFGQNSGKTPPQVQFNMTACAPAQPAGKK